MRIGFISHWYDPEGGAAAGPGTIARALAQRGHDVHVITGFPTYPTGKVFPNYKIRPYVREMVDNITVHRTAIFPSHDTRAVARMANYLSFSATGSVTALSVLRQCDVSFVYSSPATTAAAAIALRAVSGVPYVLQVQDLWPDTVLGSGFVASSHAQSAMNALLDRYCNYTYRFAHKVAVTSPGMIDLLRARGVSIHKLAYTPNWADTRSFYPKPADTVFKFSLGLRRPFVAMYAGNLGEMQSLDIVIDAAHILRHRTDIEFALVGAGVIEQQLRRRVTELNLTNVTFVEPQPFDNMSSVLAVGDVQLITLKDIPLFRATTPSKLQANLASGRPIIAALSGDARAIVQESGAGYTILPGSALELAEAVRRMADSSTQKLAEFAQCGRTYYERHFSEPVIAERLDHLLADAAKAGRTAR